MAVVQGIKRLVMRLMKVDNILAQDTGRLFEHMRDQGEQVETLWESGKTIREDNQTLDTGGRARYLKREGS